MTTRNLSVAVLGAILATAPVVSATAFAADRDHPVVVELFQSQGCSSCPPANANVLALANRPDVLALSFQVTYWDQLGWKDTFASPKYTERQWDYARTLKHSQVWTPQVVVNGRIDTVGTRRGEIEQVIARADRGVSGPTVKSEAGRVTVSGVAKAMPAEVWLVRYEPNIIQVPIRRGENGGKTLPHRNVVRELVRLGDWSGAQRDYALPKSANANLKTAILVQQGRGGAIIAAARL